MKSSSSLRASISVPAAAGWHWGHRWPCGARVCHSPQTGAWPVPSHTDSEVISSKTGIVNLQNDAGVNHRICKKSEPSGPSMIFRQSPVWPGVPSSPGVLWFCSPVSGYPPPGSSHLLQVGGQAVAQAPGGSFPRPGCPLHPPDPWPSWRPRFPDPSVPDAGGVDTEIQEPEPLCACIDVGQGLQAGRTRWPDDCTEPRDRSWRRWIGRLKLMMFVLEERGGQDSRCWVVSFNSLRRHKCEC